MYDVYNEYNEQQIIRALILYKNVLDCNLLLEGYFKA